MTDIQFYFVVLIDIFYYGRAFGVRVLRVLKVLKFDGAFGPEGGGIALSGDEYKVDVTGLAFCITWHDKHSVIGSLRSPPPFPLCRTST